MATKAEQFRAEQQRAHRKNPRKNRAAKKKPKKAAWSRDKQHAAVKATHALEEVAPGGRPSRKSTRTSANRAKPDAPFNLTEEARKTAPETRARKFRARILKVRGRRA